MHCNSVHYLFLLVVLFFLQVKTKQYTCDITPKKEKAHEILIPCWPDSITPPSPDACREAKAKLKLFIAQNRCAKNSMLSIADFSQPSTKKRLYIMDIAAGKLLCNTYVAHGKNSGELYANFFDNTAGTFKSSLGMYVTGDVYTGSHGLSLRLKGIEKGINDQAEARGIVLHGADYVSEDFIACNGRLGRSLGCPAIPIGIADSLIQLIKGGSLLFIYHPSYSTTSLPH